MIDPPEQPPEPTADGPTYVAHGGRVWRRSNGLWWDLHPAVADRLRAGLEADAENKADWFHPQARRLADEISAALAEAERQQEAA